ncbi:MAG: hypothetical protein M8861_06770, partial [marine benthic group bacterium]|nr:hypothetical protein [Gemmatimonadota bacterium]
HVWRSGERPEEALPQVLSRVRHIHIRDCLGPGPRPGDPPMQACGRGEIDLMGYFKAMVDADYDGPVCLEVIGAREGEIWVELPRSARDAVVRVDGEAAVRIEDGHLVTLWPVQDSLREDVVFRIGD